MMPRVEVRNKNRRGMTGINGWAAVQIENKMKILRVIVILVLLIGAQAETASAQNGAPDDEVQTFRLHVTAPGDTLRSVAARRDVLRDPLKWIILYRLNRDELARFKVSPARLADAPLPAGLNIIYISPPEARKQAAGNALKGDWVVSLISDKKLRKVESLAVRLVDKGYNAYILPLTWKKRTRYDLRVGFFPDRAQAQRAGRQMIRLSGLTPLRILKAPLKEIREFRGYID
jgi:hypothetical protein